MFPNTKSNWVTVSYPLGLHNLGHKVVFVHGTHPLADGGTGFGDLGDGSWLKLLIVNVGLDGLDHTVWNIVLQRMVGEKETFLSQISSMLFTRLLRASPRT